MKIAIIHSQLKHSGGMERYLMDLIQGFVNAQDQVDVFVAKVAKNVDVPEGVNVHRWQASFLPRAWRKYVFWKRCDRQFHREHYDLSISLTRTGAADVLICGGVHARFINEFGNSGRRGLHEKIELAFERRAFNNATAIVAHSKLLVKEIAQYYPTVNNKVTMLYPPVNATKFALPHAQHIEQWRAQYNINPNKITLLFPSTGHKRKGLHELLLAMQQLPSDQFDLVVVGAKVKQALPDNVRFLGYVQHIEQLYAAVNFTILPSHYEPFGLIVPESLQCGTPVIVGPQTGAAELLQPNEGIVLADNSPKTIAQTLQSLSNHSFDVAPDFIGRHHLTLAKHIADLKSLVA